MRIVVVAAVLVVAVAPASAADHGTKINEVGLSKGGSSTIQFIELFDTFGAETYPNGPYKLVFFDAVGTQIGMTSLTLSGSHDHWYVATAAADTAYGTTRNDTLGTSLPQDGQVCFQRSTGVNVTCAAWGCITSFVVTGEPRMPTPPDNMSAQRQTNGSYQIATPTPNAIPNIAGATIANCPTDPQDVIADDAGFHDASTDAGNGNTGGGGGCCSVNGNDGAFGGTLLAALTLVVLRRRRRCNAS